MTDIEKTTPTGRGPKFETEEFEVLARNWGETTENSEIGTDQKATTFWSTIAQKHKESKFGYKDRTAESLNRAYIRDSPTPSTWY